MNTNYTIEDLIMHLIAKGDVGELQSEYMLAQASAQDPLPVLIDSSAAMEKSINDQLTALIA